MKTNTQKCINRIFKTLLIEDFFPFATGVVDTGGAPWVHAYLPRIFAKCYKYRGPGETIHEQTRSEKYFDTVPLNILVSLFEFELDKFFIKRL